MKSGLLFAALLALCPLAQAAPATVRVLGPDGKPVAGATVVYEPPATDDRVFHSFTTDAGGLAKVEVSTGGRDKREWMGAASAWAPGLAPGTVAVRGAAPPGEITLRLAAAHSVSGEVRSADGNAVAGAGISVAYIVGNDEQGLWLNDHPLAASFSTKTDAAGHYTIAGLPPTGRATIALDDPRYVSSRVRADLTGNTVPLLEARPGAVFKGRIVQDGASAPGIAVVLQSTSGQVNGFARARSAADGTFQVSGLESGPYAVMATVPRRLERVAAAVLATATEGESAVLPDLVLTSGAVIEGVVRDSKTREPIEGAIIGSYGPHRPEEQGSIISAKTEADGRYRVRVAAGNNKIYVAGAANYLTTANKGASREFRIESGATRTEDFDLTRGVAFTGTARDAAGQPLAGITLRITRNSWLENKTDTQGRFAFDGLPPGPLTIAASGLWQLVSPAKIVAPGRDVVLTLEKRRTSPVRGRVIDDKGQPVQGASVHVDVYDNEYSDRRDMLTDADGRYEWKEVPTGAQAGVSVRKSGWRVKTAPRSTATREVVGINGQLVPNSGAAIVLSDAVLQRLGEKLSAEILENGQPASGAIAGLYNNQTRSDAAGRFTLTDLPEGESVLFAASAASFASQRVKPGAAGLQVKLEQQTYGGQSVVAGREALRQLATETTNGDFGNRGFLAADLAAIDIPGAFALQKELFKEPNAFSRWVLGKALERRSLAPDGAETEVREALKAILPEPEKADVLMNTELAIRAAKMAPDWSRVLWLKGLAALPPLPKAPTWEQLAPRFTLIVLGMAIDDPRAPALLDEQLDATTPLENKVNQENYFRTYAEFAAQASSTAGGLAAVEKILAKAPEISRMEAYSAAIPILAKRNLAAANRLLAQMEALPPTSPKTHDAADGTTVTNSASRFEYAFGMAAVSVARQQSWAENPDGESILALARRISNVTYKAEAMAYAARALGPGKATALWREAFTLAPRQNFPGDLRGFIVLLALNSDRAAGQQLADEMQKSLYQERGYAGYLMERASLAFALAPFEPGRARWLLETAWAARFEDGHWPEDRDEAGLVLAMSAIDPKTAGEWVTQIGGTNPAGTANPFAREGQVNEARRAMAKFQLAPESQRRAFSLMQWAQGFQQTWKDDM